MAKKVVRKGSIPAKKKVSKPYSKPAPKKPVKKPAPAPKKKPVVKTKAAKAPPKKPARAPVRRVVGRRAAAVERNPDVSPPPAADAAAPAPGIPSPPAASAAKHTWDSIPKGVPAHIKFLMKEIAAECSVAATWPFPMGQFLANIPQQVCAHEFACLLLSLEHGAGRIGELCGVSEEQAAQLVESGTEHIQDYFASICPDIDRKWRATIRGPGVRVENLVDQHLVAKVDRNMQVVIGQMILATLAG